MYQLKINFGFYWITFMKPQVLLVSFSSTDYKTDPENGVAGSNFTELKDTILIIQKLN